MESKRNVYLKMKTLEEAHVIVDDTFAVTDVLEIETVPVPEAVGTTRPVASPPGPHVRMSASDGPLPVGPSPRPGAAAMPGHRGGVPRTAWEAYR